MAEVKPKLPRKSSSSKSSKFAKPVAPPPKKPAYDVPNWAGKPPAGMHLDITKGDRVINKHIVDGKSHFFFGRQHEFIDFPLEHTSCSRVHAVITYHSHLHRMFLTDLGSVHGTFLGTIRLEANRPMQLAIDDTFHFGASTRLWTLREKPTSVATTDDYTDSRMNSEADGATTNDTSGLANTSLMGLPESETEVDDLTEFNTAHNRRLATLTIDDPTAANPLTRLKRKAISVQFDGNDEIINPEDVDPTVGRFRNLISTEIIIPNKRVKVAEPSPSNEATTPTAPSPTSPDKQSKSLMQEFHSNNLYGDVTAIPLPSPTATNMTNFSVKITSAPDVEAPDVPLVKRVVPPPAAVVHASDLEAAWTPAVSHRVYVKEAWPGRKPKGPHNLLSV